ncbi:hypothetical protein JW905_05105 [bacterium]|nr:hypothetical protein [candidate division CSSED10-310 bacterium]
MVFRLLYITIACSVMLAGWSDCAGAAPPTAGCFPLTDYNALYEYYYDAGPYRMDLIDPQQYAGFIDAPDNTMARVYMTQEGLHIKDIADRPEEGMVSIVTPPIQAGDITLEVHFDWTELPPETAISFSINGAIRGGDKIASTDQEQRVTGVNVTMLRELEVCLAESSSDMAEMKECEIAADRMRGTLILSYSHAARRMSCLLNDVELFELPVFYEADFFFRLDLAVTRPGSIDFNIGELTSDVDWTRERTLSAERTIAGATTAEGVELIRESEGGARRDQLVVNSRDGVEELAMRGNTMQYPSGVAMRNEFVPALPVARRPTADGVPHDWTVDCLVISDGEEKYPLRFEGHVTRQDATVCVPAGCFMDCLVVEGAYLFPKKTERAIYYYAPHNGLVKQQRIDRKVNYQVVQLVSSDLLQPLPLPLIHADSWFLKPGRLQIKAGCFNPGPPRQLQLAMWIEVNDHVYYWDGRNFSLEFHTIPVFTAAGYSLVHELEIDVPASVVRHLSLEAAGIFLDPVDPFRTSTISRCSFHSPR